MLPQYALDDISNAIISGKIINTGSPSGIFE
jgi:hypothetical protein